MGWCVDWTRPPRRVYRGWRMEKQKCLRLTSTADPAAAGGRKRWTLRPFHRSTGPNCSSASVLSLARQKQPSKGLFSGRLGGFGLDFLLLRAGLLASRSSDSPPPSPGLRSRWLKTEVSSLITAAQPPGIHTRFPILPRTNQGHSQESPSTICCGRGKNYRNQ